MSLNNRLCQLGLFASLLCAAPLWGQNTITLVGCPTSAAPASKATCDVYLNLQNGATVDTLSFGLTVTANSPAPTATSSNSANLRFTDTTAAGGGSAPGASPTAIAPFWEGMSPVLSGSSEVATIAFTMPTGATAGSYTFAFTGASAALGGLGGTAVPITLGPSATVAVATTLTITAPSAAALTPAATANAAYTNSSFAASGGITPYTWTATGLPAGLSISSTTGVISGTPTTAGTSSSINVTVKDSASTPASATGLSPYSLVVNAALSNMLPATLPGGTENSAYSQAVSVSGGTGPYTWAATGLPTGMNISASTTNSATIGGTPTVPATGASVKVTVTDANGATLSTTYSLTIAGPLTLVPASGALAIATVSNAYTTGTTIVASGGTPPYTFTASGLPPGLAISSTSGAISGTPTTSGAYNSVLVTVTDHASATVTNTYSIQVNPAIVISAPTSLPNGTTGAPYPPTAITAAASGGSGTYTWSISGLPGVTIGASTGIVSGTPTSAGTDNVTITATDTNGTGATGKATFTGVVIAPGVSISSPASGSALGVTAGSAYSVSVVSTGGTAPYTWTSTGLPTGLTLSNSTTGTATISGTVATAAAAAPVTVTVADHSGSANTANYTLTVNAVPSLATATLPVATVGSAYTSGTKIVLTGGTSPITWTTTPALPSGLSISNTGVIIGTPATGTSSATPYTVAVKATDANGAVATQSYTFTIDPALAVTPTTIPAGIPGVVYTRTTLTATGGSGSGYTFTATGLPGGLTLTTGGVLSGTATSTDVSKNYSVVVTVVDGIGTTANFNYTLTLAPPLVITGPSTLPAGTANVQYTATTVSATGGTPPYIWSATNLPPGLSIGASTGTISGSPTSVAGSPYAVTVKVTDQNGTIATTPYTIAVAALPLQIITGLLPPGVLNTPYPTTNITVNGGVAPYTWSITGLPAGLTTNGSGVISGTPTTTTGSPFSVVVTVTDATLTSVSRTFSLSVSGTLTVVLPTTLPAAALNTAYTPVTATAAGGLAPYTWTATGLPAGMTINVATGVVSGTPTSAVGSPYSVTLTVTDSTGKTASQTYTLTVGAPLTITGPASLPAATVGTPYTATTIAVTGGSGVYTYTETGLPSGLTISSTTGAISGTPAANTAGTDTVVITVTDSSSNQVTKSYSLTINPGVSLLPIITSVSANTEGQSLIGPNTWVSVYGSNFEPTTFTDTWTTTIKASTTGALPIILDGVSVMIGGTAVYVEYVSATQINVLTPSIGFGPLSVTVTTTVGTSNAVTITSQPDVPGLFEWPNNQPVATHSADYSYAAAPGTFAGQTTVPAAPGETIVLWGSGFGPTSPANPFGVAIPATPTYETSSNVTVTLNNAPITVYQNVAFLTAGNAGLYQLGATIPANLPNGTYPLVVSINGITSPALMLTVAAPAN